MTTTSAITDLLALSLKVQNSRSPKVSQASKMKAGKVVSEMYPSYIMEHVNFLKARKKSNKSKESRIGIKLSK